MLLRGGDKGQVPLSPARVSGSKIQVPRMGRCMFASAFFVLRGQINGGKRRFLFNGLNKIGQKLASSLNNLHLCPRQENRRTKQEQRPSLFGLCLARRRKTVAQRAEIGGIRTER